MATFTLETPSLARLPAYTQRAGARLVAQQVRDVSGEQLALIRADTAGFIASLLDPSGSITLPDGSGGAEAALAHGLDVGRRVLRLASACAGSRAPTRFPHMCWGTSAMPSVPWKRGHAYAAQCIGTDAARGAGPWASSAWRSRPSPDNFASRRTIEKNGGRLVERVRQSDLWPGAQTALYDRSPRTSRTARIEQP